MQHKTPYKGESDGLIRENTETTVHKIIALSINGDESLTYERVSYIQLIYNIMYRSSPSSDFILFSQ